ncbi:hypothetical protein D5S17_09435 [Pseudonocardiaceae bacterium YIM PH 21723]|nr:hypothetical protein D5S17_09435 [Pseudonocardiaceae bacterium YIM PH 21723]
MQTHGGQSAQDAITSPERHFLISVQVDWARNGSQHPLSEMAPYISTITVDRALRGSAPEELLLIEGSSAAELSFTAAGEYAGMPLTAIFSPLQGASPFFLTDPEGVDISYQVGVETVLGTVWYQQLRGQVRTIEIDRSAGTIEVTALDYAEALRRPIQLPTWALSEEHVGWGKVDAQLCRSHWVIDHCLRLSNASPSPWRPNLREETQLPPESTQGPQLFVSGNGSILPTLGWCDNPQAISLPGDGTTMFTATGPLHPKATPETPRPLALAGLGLPISWVQGEPGHRGILKYWAADRDGIVATAVHYGGFTLNTNGPAADAYRSIERHQVLGYRTGDRLEMQYWLEKGRVRVEIHNWNAGKVEMTSSWVEVPAGMGNVEVFAQWDNSAQSGGRIYLRAGTNSNGGLTSYGASLSTGQYDQFQGRIQVGHALSLSDINLASRQYRDAGINPQESRRPARYPAVLDQGVNKLTFTPEHTARDAWDIVTEVASAEFGSVFFDENGTFRFWNQATVRDKATRPVRTITLDDAQDLKLTRSLDSVRNIYTADIGRRRAVFTQRMIEARDPDEYVVAGQSFRHFRIWRDDVLSPFPERVNAYATNGASNAGVWNDSVGHGYVAQLWKDGRWQEPGNSGGVYVYCYFEAAGRLVVRIGNGYSEPIRLTTDSGQPALRIAGTRVLDSGTQPLIVRDQPSIDRYQGRNLSLFGPWYQDAPATSAMLSGLLERTRRPSATTDAITIAGDPRLQLGDAVTLEDPEGIGENAVVQIYGIRRTFDRDSGLTDTLTVELTRPPSAGTWDTGPHFFDTSITWS